MSLIEFITNRSKPFRPMPGDAVFIKPTPVMLSRIINGVPIETKNVLLNPKSLSINVEAKYKTQEVPGVGAHPVQYVNTTNPRIPIQLFYDRLVLENEFASGLGSTFLPTPNAKNIFNLPGPPRLINLGPAEFNSPEDFYQFLLSLVYPDNVGSPLTRSAPPKLLLLWPGFLSVTGIVRRLKFDFIDFATFGSPIRIVANLEMEVIRSRRSAISREVRIKGFRVD